MQRPRALVLIAILAMLAACGGGGPGDEGDDGDNTAQSEPAGQSAAPPPDDDDDDDDDDGGGGGGGSPGDAEEAYERLTPPNAVEVSKTTAGELIVAGFNTPDSMDSLTSFYEDAFDELGLQILTTTEAAGGITWFVGTDANASEFGGVITVVPSTDGGSGSSVSLQIGATNE